MKLNTTACGGRVETMIEIQPVPSVNAELRIPGSKSLTQRALIAAALASGESRLCGPLVSEDTEYSAQALARLGVRIDREDQECWIVEGNGGTVHADEYDDLPRQ